MRSYLYALVLSMLGVAVLTGCSTANPVYRTYYQDPHCQIFYVDGAGNRVYEWKSSTHDITVGRKMCRDASGRLFYQDSWGNRIYEPMRHCNGCSK